MCDCVCQHVCFCSCFVFFTGVCCKPLYLLLVRLRGIIGLFFYTPTAVNSLYFVGVCACVCGIEFDWMWLHLECSLCRCCESWRSWSWLTAIAPRTFHPSEGLSMDSVFAYGLTNAPTDTHTHHHVTVNNMHSMYTHHTALRLWLPANIDHVNNLHLNAFA